MFELVHVLQISWRILIAAASAAHWLDVQDFENCVLISAFNLAL